MPIKQIDGRMIDGSKLFSVSNSFLTNVTSTNSFLTNVTSTNSFLTNVTGTNSFLTSITGTNSLFANSLLTSITGTNFYLDGTLTVSDASSVIGLSSKVVTNEYITNTYEVTSLNVNGNINTTGNMYGGIGINIVPGTSYTVNLSDNGGMIASTNNGAGLTATVVGTDYLPGFQVAFMQLSGSTTTGRITVSGQNITINQANGYFKTTKQYSAATLIYFGPEVGWVLFGDVSA